MLQVSWVAAEAQLCLWRTPPSVRARLKSWSGPAALGTESLSARWLFLLWTHTCHTRPAAASQGALWDSPALQPYGTYCSWSTDAQMPAKTNNIFYLCFLINSFIFSTFCLFFFFPPLTSGMYGLRIFSSTPLGFSTTLSASSEPMGEFGLKLMLFLLGERTSTV